MVWCVRAWGGQTPHRPPARAIVLQAKAAKREQEAARLRLRSLQYLERYVYLVLFNAYLHLQRAEAWQRPFSSWMRQVRGAPRGSPVGRAVVWLYGKLPRTGLCLVPCWVSCLASARGRPLGEVGGVNQ